MSTTLEQQLVAVELQIAVVKKLKKERKREVKVLRASHGDSTEAERQLKTIEDGLIATKAERKALIAQLLAMREDEEVA